MTSMSNFTPYQTTQFASFAPAALAAERLCAIDPAVCALGCRRALEPAALRRAEEPAALRRELAEGMAPQIAGLDQRGFAVRLHLREVERFSSAEAYERLTYENVLQLEELAALLPPAAEDAAAVQFDTLLYGMELALLAGRSYAGARRDLLRKARAIAAVAHIPAIERKRAFLDRLLRTDYVETAGIGRLEEIRRELRDLIKYIPPQERAVYTVDLTDEVVSSQWRGAELESDDLADYRERVNYYIRQHQNEEVIRKLHANAGAR